MNYVWIYIGLYLCVDSIYTLMVSAFSTGFTSSKIHRGLATYYVSSNASFPSSFCGPAIVNRVPIQGAIASLSPHYFKVSDDYDTPFAFLGPSDQHPLCLDHGCIQVWPTNNGPKPPYGGDRNMTIVKITDICNGCTKDQIELSIEAFGEIGNCNSNVASVYWRFVDCKRVILGPIFKEASQNITYLDQDAHTRANIAAQVQKELSHQE